MRRDNANLGGSRRISADLTVSLGAVIEAELLSLPHRRAAPNHIVRLGGADSRFAIDRTGGGSTARVPLGRPGRLSLSACRVLQPRVLELHARREPRRVVHQVEQRDKAVPRAARQLEPNRARGPHRVRPAEAAEGEGGGREGVGRASAQLAGHDLRVEGSQRGEARLRLLQQRGAREARAPLLAVWPELRQQRRRLVVGRQRLQVGSEVARRRPPAVQQVEADQLLVGQAQAAQLLPDGLVRQRRPRGERARDRAAERHAAAPQGDGREEPEPSARRADGDGARARASLGGPAEERAARLEPARSRGGSGPRQRVGRWRL